MLLPFPPAHYLDSDRIIYLQGANYKNMAAVVQKWRLSWSVSGPHLNGAKLQCQSIPWPRVALFLEESNQVNWLHPH